MARRICFNGQKKGNTITKKQNFLVMKAGPVFALYEIYDLILHSLISFLLTMIVLSAIQTVFVKGKIGKKRELF